MNGTDRVTAVVVTCNRKALLLECLGAIAAQTRPVEKILLIDNASTDGTREAVEQAGFPGLEYLRMDTNTGGAGGFYHGLERAREEDCGWLWLMDDDTIPEPDSLEKLLEGIGKIRARKQAPVGFAASTVYGPAGEYMNVPLISSLASPNGYSGWYDLLADGIVAVDNVTFVSVLISRDAVRRCGLPCMDYFLWGDDFEYTNRIAKHYGPGYFIGASRVIHKRANAKTLDIAREDDPKRLGLYHYYYRNNAVNWRLYKNRSGFGLFLSGVKDTLVMLLKGRSPKKAGIILRGNVEALAQFRRFKGYIDQQLSEGAARAGDPRKA